MNPARGGRGVLIAVLLVFVSSVAFPNVVPAASDTWPFENTSPYSYDNSLVEVSGSMARLSGDDWMNSSWSRRLKITVHADSVDAGVQNFPVYVDLSTLPSSFFNNVDPAGADIRLTRADGTTKVAREVVSIDNTSDTGELYFKAPTLNASSDTYFYIYYDNSGASAPAEDSTYGAENVWSNGYEVVWHLQETTGDTTYDSTSNNHDGTLISDLVWFDTDWDHRKKITIDADSVPTDLSNYPLMIELRGDTGLRDEAQNNGDDIVFTRSDKTTQLDHEIELFDGGSGDLVAWVRMPDLPSGSDTSIYVYYGNNAASNQENVAAVWDSNYKGVWHLSETPASNPSDWFDVSWNKRKKITIDHTQVEGDLTDFPVLVDISGDGDLAADAKSNGEDLLFASYDGSETYPHEIESFDGGSGDLVAWVKVPQLSASSDTHFYLYYDNPSASDLQDTASVWPSDYKGVWHLGESSGSALDSTSNDNDGTVNGPTQGVSGVANGAYDFEQANNDDVTVSDDASLDPSYVHYSAWIRSEAFINNQGVIAKGDGSNRQYWLWQYDDASVGGNTFHFEVDETSYKSSFPILNTSTWYKFDIVYDGNSTRAYLNGILSDSQAQSTGTVLGDNTGLQIGQLQSFENWDGEIDEVRVKDGSAGDVSSGAWIRTEYNNQVASQARENIVIDTTTQFTATEVLDVTSDSAGIDDSQVLTFNHSIGGDRDRLLVVGVAVEDDDAGTDVEQVTYNGVQLTKAVEQTVGGSGFEMNTELWYMLDDQLPSSGSYEVRVELVDPPDSGTIRFQAGAISAHGAAQEAPEATNSNAATSVSSISTSITTSTDKALVFDMVGAGDGDNTGLHNYSPTNGAQTREVQHFRGSSSGAGGTLENDVAGSVTLGWDFEDDAGSAHTANRTSHVLAAWAPASKNVSFDHPIGTGDKRLLVVQIAAEDGGDDNNVNEVNDVTYNGVSLTKAVENRVGPSDSNNMNTELWYLLESNLPAAGTYTVNIDFAGPPRTAEVGATSIFHAAQQAPEATAANDDGEAGNDSISTTINTQSDGSWVFDVVGSGADVDLTTSDPQIKRWESNTTTSTGRASTLHDTDASTDPTLSWSTTDSSNRISHVLASFAPAPPVPFINVAGEESLTTDAIKDSTSNNNHGTDQGSMTGADQLPGKMDGHLDFDGVDDSVDIPNDSSLEPTSEITVSLWLRRDGVQKTWAKELFYGQNDVAPYGPYGINFQSTSDQTLDFHLALDGSLSNVTASSSIADTTWYHVVGTFDGSTQKILVDGELMDSKSISGSITNYDDFHDLVFGDRNEDDQEYDGSLDEIRISDVARSDSWVATQHNNADTVNFYQVGNQQDTSEIASKPTMGESGQIEKAAGFDSTAQRVEDGESFPSGNNGDTLTGMAWINPDKIGSVSDRQAIMSVDEEWGMNLEGELVMRLWGAHFRANTQLTAGQWQHVGFVWDAGSDVSLFLNGQPDGSTSETNTSSNTGNNFAIGAQSDDQRPYEGLIDEVRVARVQRSDGWISSTYNNQNDPANFYSVDSEQTESDIFSDTAPTVVNDGDPSLIFRELSSFSDTAGTNNEGSIRYQISPDGSTWYYHDGGSWSTASDTSDTNTASEIDANAASFDDVAGTGTFHFKAFLVSDGTQRVQLDTVGLHFRRPVITDLSGTATVSGSDTGVHLFWHYPAGDNQFFRIYRVKNSTDTSGAVAIDTAPHKADTITYTDSSAIKGDSQYYYVTAVDTDGNESDSSSEATAAHLTVSKSDNADSPHRPGDTIVYTITYTNNGFGPSSSIVVVDALPSSTSLAESARVVSGPSADSVEYEVDGNWQSSFDPSATRVRWIISGLIDPQSSGNTGQLEFKVGID